MVLAWRDDVGAYVLFAYPKRIADEVDGQDLMSIYNIHRFRGTRPNFQFVSRGDFSAASFYSGGYDSNYIGKANYCVTLILDAGENPNKYEKPLIKATSYLLSQLDDSMFDIVLEDTFHNFKYEKFDDIVAAPSLNSSWIDELKEEEISDEKKIFKELMESDEMDTSDREFDEKKEAFEKAVEGGDPFSGGGISAEVAFKEDAFKDIGIKAQKPMQSSLIGSQLIQTSTTASTAAQLLEKLDDLEKNPPKELDAMDKETKFKYLEEKVAYLEEKLRVISQIANKLRESQKELDEKDELIGKLLLLIKD